MKFSNLFKFYKTYVRDGYMEGVPFEFYITHCDMEEEDMLELAKIEDKYYIWWR